MTKQNNKVQLILELEEAQKRIAELEQANQLKASIQSGFTEQDRHGEDAFYRTFIEQSHDGVIILDEQGNVSVWNSAQETITGIPQEEAIGQKYWDVQFRLLTAETRTKTTSENIKAALQNTFKTGEYFSLGKLREAELQPVTGGGIKFIQLSPFTIKTKDGFRIGLITRDITKQRRAADAIKENEERFSHVFHASPAQMAITDISNGKYIDVNEAFLQSLGFSREEVIDKTASELNLFVDANQRAALLVKMKEQGYLQEETVLVRAKSGSVRHGVFSAKYIQVQDHQFLLTVMNDITERKQMEDALSKNQQILLETQSVAKLQSWVANFQTGELIIGPGYDHILEQAAGVYKLDDIRNFVHPQDREYVEKAWAQAAQDQSLDVEYRILLNGDMKWVHAKTNTIPNENEKTASVPGFTQDVTERRQAEELTHAQRNLARLASTTTSIEEALPHCLNAALNVSGMDCGGIYLFDTDQQSLDLVYHQGLGMDFIQTISHYPAHASNVQTVLAGMMFYFAEKDMEKDKAHQKEGLQSLAVIPILDHGHVLGCINIGSHTLKQIPEVARQAIETITTEIGTVIAHLRTENLLRDSEEKYRSLINSQESAISTLDAEGVFHYINRIGAAPLTDSPDKVIGQTLYDFFPANVADWQLNHIRTVIASGQGLISEYQTSITGKPSWRRVSIQPIHDANGQVTLAMVNSLDITDRKQVEEDLKEARERLLEAQELAHVGHWEWDLKNHALIWSDEVYKIFGVTPNEYMPTVESFENYIHPEDKADFLQQREKMLAEKQFACIDHRIILSDGQIRHVQERTQITLDANGELTRVIGTVQDITERKLSEEASQKNTQILHESQAIANLGSWTADLKAGIFDATPEGARLVGWTPGQHSSDELIEIIHPEDREHMQNSWAAAMQGAPYDIEHRILLNGETRWLHITAKITFDKDGNPISALGVTQDITDRKKAEEERRESDDRYRLLFETMVQGVVFQNSEGVIIHANSAAERILGLSLDQMQGRASIDPRWKSIHEDGSDFPGSTHPAMLSLQTGQPVYNTILGVYNPTQDSHRWLNVNTIPRFNGDHKKPYQVYTTFEDITERKLSENAMLASEKQLKSLIDSQTHFVIRVNMAGKYVYWNNQFEKEFGWVHSPEGLQNGDVMRTICKHHHQRVFEVVQQCITQPGKVISVEIDKPARGGGIRTTLWEFICLTDERSQPSEIQCMGMEITDRKKAEEALHQIEKRNTSLIEHAPDGIALVDVNGVFTFASPSAYRMFGYGPEEIIGIQSREKVHPQDVYLLANLRDKLHDRPNEPQTVEYRFLHKDGSYHWLESTYTNMFNEPGIEGIVINFRDITERKLAEETTLQQNKQIQFLYEASQQLNRTLELKEIFQTICDFMEIIAPSDTIFISAYDQEKQLITCSAYWMEGTWLDVSPFPAIPLEEEGRGTQSMVIRSGKALLANDYQTLLKNTQNIYYVNDETNEIVDDDPPEEELTRSALIVPLRSGGKVTGIIQAASYRQNAYTENQLKLLESLALHIASAEQNATLYTKMVNELNERRQAEIALRASEEKYRVLIESFDNVVASVDIEGRFLYMNDTAAGQMDNATDNLIGKTMYELFPEAIAFTQMNHIQQVISEDKGLVLESISMVKGEPRWYRTSIQPIHDEEGRVNQVLINSTDIHGIKTAQQELQELNRTLEERVKQRTAEVQDLYDNASAGYHSLDANGNLLLINKTELNWLGYTQEEVMGRSIFNILTSNSLAIFTENFPIFKKRGWLKDLELEFVRKDGSTIPILVNATAIYDEHGNYLMSRSTVLDNTEHKAADEALRNANLEMARAMRMKDEFLASMSHELRTPLNGILGLSEALQLDVYGVLTDKQKSTLGHIEDSGRHLLELINDILDVSKIEAGKFELEMAPCSLGDICQSSIQLTKGMAGKKNQNVSFTMNPASITINADGRRLKQVLVNLLSNAVKFTPESGSLGMEVTEDAANKIVHITVWDNGIGISAENIKKLFQPFVQLDSSLSRQQTGTGLGLTLVQRLVEMHGGSIEIQSTPGQGSRFTVALSCMSADSTAEFVENIFQSKFHYALIIEDESMDAGHLARYCRSLGISPILHSTGKDALERVISTRPNIVFLDIHLPDISGWDVLVQLKTNPETRHIPVVITSVDDEKQKAHQLKADGYLVKFFAVSDLRAMLINLQKTPSAIEISNIPSDGPIATVIIVDDNEINIETVEDYLGAKNFNVVSARSGVDFLDRVSHLNPDIVLMDIQMPEMDGLETIRRLRGMADQKLASVPVIALTALAMPGDREHCIEAGADEYVTKPFRLKELQELLMQMLEDKKRVL